MKRLIVILLLSFFAFTIYAQKSKDEKGTGNANENQGVSNTKISTGASGVRRSISYRFSPMHEDSDPGNGTFRLDKDSLSQITFILVDNNDLSGDDQSKWYSTWDDATGASGRGRIHIVDPENNNITIFDVSGIMTNAGGYWKVPVKYVSGLSLKGESVYYYIFERIAHKKTENEQEQVTETVVPTVQPVVQEVKEVIQQQVVAEQPVVEVVQDGNVVVPEVVHQVTPEPVVQTNPEVVQPVTPVVTETAIQVTPELVAEIATPVIEQATVVVPEVVHQVTPEPVAQTSPEVVQPVTPVVTETVIQVTPEPVAETATPVVEQATVVAPEVVHQVTPEPVVQTSPGVIQPVTPVVPETAIQVTPEPVAEIATPVVEQATVVAPEVVHQVTPEPVVQTSPGVVQPVTPVVTETVSQVTSEPVTEIATPVVEQSSVAVPETVQQFASQPVVQSVPEVVQQVTPVEPELVSQIITEPVVQTVQTKPEVAVQVVESAPVVETATKPEKKAVEETSTNEKEILIPKEEIKAQQKPRVRTETKVPGKTQTVQNQQQSTLPAKKQEVSQNQVFQSTTSVQPEKKVPTQQQQAPVAQVQSEKTFQPATNQVRDENPIVHRSQQAVAVKDPSKYSSTSNYSSNISSNDQINQSSSYTPPVQNYQLTPVDQDHSASYQNSAGTATRTRRKWYRGIIEADLGAGINDYGINNFRINFINGVRIGRFASAGLGIGFRKYFDKPASHPEFYVVSEKVQIPVFLDLRATFTSKRLTPYAALGIGNSQAYGTKDAKPEGLMINPSAGLWFNVSDRFAIFAGFAYEMQQLQYAKFADDLIFKEYSRSVSLNIGISF